MPRFRTILDTMPAYKPGKAVTSPDGRSYKLSSNESPYDPLPSVVEAIAEGARQIHRYPDPGAIKLTEAIAERFGVPVEHIALGAGSVTVAQQLFEAVGDPGAEVIYALAVVRGLSAAGRPGRGGVRQGAAGGGGPTIWTRWPRRSPTGHADLRLQPQQPHRHRVRGRRAGGVPRPSARRRARRAGRGLPRVPARRGLPDGLDIYRDRPNVASCAPSPRPMVWPGCASATRGRPEAVAALRKTISRSASTGSRRSPRSPPCARRTS